MDNIKDKKNTFINYCLKNEKIINSKFLYAHKNKKLEAVLVE